MRSSWLAISWGLLGCTRAAVVPTPPAVPAGAEPQAAASGSACEREWMTRWAEAHGLQPRECRELALDDDDALERVLQACAEDGQRAVYLVDDERGRWVIEHDGWGHVPVCEPAALAGGHALVLLDTGPGDSQERRVALRDGRPAIVEERWASVRDVPLAVDEAWDYDQGRLHRRIEGGEGKCEGGGLEIDAALLVVGGPEVAAEWVLEGASSFHGSSDAGLVARARATPDDRIRVEIEVSDDERISARSLRGTSPADAVVLRWALPSAAIDPLDCAGTEIIELRITAMADGPVLVAGPGAAAAAVEGDFDRLVIELDPRALELGAVPWRAPLSIVLIDADREGTTTIATSSAVARPGSLGAMLRNSGDLRHPSIGRSVESPQ